MIIVLALAGFLLLLAGLLFLLKDFSRFLLNKTFEPGFPRSFMDFGELLITLFVAMAMAVLGFLFYKFSTALIAYLLTKDLISFFVILRGVFTTKNDLQNPFLLKNLIAGFILSPALQFLTFYLIIRAIRTFMANMNVYYKKPVYTERDVFYFGFISVLIFALLEICFYSQKIPGISGIAHFTYLSLTKLSFVAYFLTLAHIHLLNQEHYRSSLPSYFHLEKTEKFIVFHRWRTIALSYGIGLILYIPFFTGTQFAENNWLVLLIYLIVCLVFYYLIRVILSKGYNYVGVVLIAETPVYFIDNQKSPEWNNCKKILYSLLAWTILLIIIRPKLLFFIFFIITVSAVVFCSLHILVYFSGLMFSLLRAKRFKIFIPKIHNETIISYLFITGKAIIKSAYLMFVFVSFIFLLLSIRPKSYKDLNPNYLKSVFDANENPIYIEYSNNNGSIPVSYATVPDFLLKCIYIQEDRSFLRQNSWFPSEFPRTSNWHGISFASYYRILSGGGGSNLNMQLIKNIAFTKAFPRDVQRKFAETITAYQLSLQLSPQKIIIQYLNNVGMNGGSGHSGLMAASLFTFGLPISKINSLEMMYLVTTLKNGSLFRTDQEYIKYAEADRHADEIKSTLIRQAQSWNDQNLITGRELASLKIQDLRFVNAPFKTNCHTTTEVFLADETNRIKPEGKTFRSCFSLKCQKQMNVAVKKFESQYHNYLNKQGYRLYSAALVINIETGEVIAHSGGYGLTDLTRFSQGNPVGSIIKPFVLLEMLENGFNAEDIRFFDGKIAGRKTPENYSKKYSNAYVGIDKILSASLNAPMVNLRELTDPIELFKNLEQRFSKMDIKADRYLYLGNPDKRTEIEINYPLGSRNMTLYEIAQAYQTLFNDGKYIGLSVLKSAYNPYSDKELIYNTSHQQIYSPSNTRIIKTALGKTMMPGGTGAVLLGMLPQNRNYFAKTGTSEGSIHGYTVLSDGKILIIAYVTYGKVINQRLELNDTPAIPYQSGAKSAGLLAVLIYNELNK